MNKQYEINQIKHRIDEYEQEIARLDKAENFTGIFYIEEEIERLETKLKKLEKNGGIK